MLHNQIVALNAFDLSVPAVPQAARRSGLEWHWSDLATDAPERD